MTRRLFLLATACLTGALFNFWVVSLNPIPPVDFAQFYAAGQLAGSGKLYDWESLQRVELQYSKQPVPTARLPVVAFTYKLLSYITYAKARVLWLVLSGAAAIAAVCLWPHANRGLMLVALAWSLSAGFILAFGQDLFFWLFCFAMGLYLMVRSRPVLAGVAFALCIMKFHLLLGLAVMLIAQRRWRTILAGGLTGFFLFLLCFWIEGWDWVGAYLQLLRSSRLSPGVYRMPNLHGLASWSSWPTGVEVGLAAILIIFVWYASKHASIGFSGGLAAASGLLLAHHSYGQDCILLLPLSVGAAAEPRFPNWIRVLAVALASPVMVLLLTSDYPISGQGIIVLFVMSTLFFASSFRTTSSSAIYE